MYSETSSRRVRFGYFRPSKTYLNDQSTLNGFTFTVFKLRHCLFLTHKQVLFIYLLFILSFTEGHTFLGTEYSVPHTELHPALPPLLLLCDDTYPQH